MKLMGRRALSLLALCALYAAGILFFLWSYAWDAPAWATYPVNAHLYKNGVLIAAGNIEDRDGIILAATEDGKRRFSSNAGVRKALMHLVGDASGSVATGLQVVKRGELTGWSYISGVYSFGEKGNNIRTTVDAGLCRTAYEALGGRKGCVGVMNYKTGEILCMVSSPSFDPENPPDITKNPEKYEGVYINRFLSASYPPGSIFKLVTAAAALEKIPDVENRVFECTGSLELAGGRITCPSVHKKQTFGEALTSSCNTAFAQLALELGTDTLCEYTSKAGFETAVNPDGIKTRQSSFTLDGANDADTGWAGVGQYKTQANPLSFLQFVGSIANDGSRVNPHLIKSITNSAGIPVSLKLDLPAGRSMSRETSEMLTVMMRNNVKNNYGEMGLSRYNMCAKSGTAEVGGGKTPHAWFTGFLDSEEAPLAFIVIIENGGAGSSAAAAVSAAVLKHAVRLEL